MNFSKEGKEEHDAQFYPFGYTEDQDHPSQNPSIDKGEAILEKHIQECRQTPPNPSNQFVARAPQIHRPSAIRKALLGLTPGGALPGAFAVNRRARGQAPVWSQPVEESEDNHSRPEFTQDADESERVNDARNTEPPTTEQSPKSRMYKHPAFFALTIMGILLVIGITIVTSVRLANRTRSTASPATDQADSCGLNEMQPNVHKQCECFGIIKIISSDTRQGYFALQAKLGANRQTSDLVDVETSCDPRNVALLLLAGMDTSYADTEQLWARYTLNLLFLDWNGRNWDRQRGWLDQTQQIVCDWDGITCNDKNHITGLDLHNNGAEGTIVTELGLLTSLTSLNLEGNNLKGSLPTELGNLSDLRIFTLTINDLTGPLPSELSRLTKLTSVSIGNNPFTDSPFPFWNASGLTLIHAPYCGISGRIPALQFGRMTALTSIDLQGNYLSNTIPTEIGLLTALEVLVLANSKLNGTFPTHIGDLHDLTHFDVSQNSLSGVIPTEIGRLTRLITFHAYGNHFTGALPTEIGNCTLLQSLLIDSNDLEGKIPVEALGRLANLDELFAFENNFSGSVPSESTLCESIVNGNLIVVLDCDILCSCCTDCT